MALNPNVVVVAPGDLITAQHLNNVRSNLDRLDTAKVSDTGDVMTGPLTATQFVASDAAGASRFDGHLVIGTVAIGSNLSDGWEFRNTGLAFSYNYTAGQSNLFLDHIAAASVDTSNYVQFRINQATAVVGAIKQVSTTGVQYLTTSDKRLKTLIGPADKDAALAKVCAMEPVTFTWKAEPGDGEQVGFFAQDLQAVAPEAVAVGVGEPGQDGFEPWGIDPARLVPTLIAAVQALTARVQALEAAAA